MWMFGKYARSNMQAWVTQVNCLAFASQFCFAQLYFKIEVSSKWSFGEKENFSNCEKMFNLGSKIYTEAK